MKDIEGVKVTSSDGENAIGFTIEIDVKKFKLDDAESREKRQVCIKQWIPH